MIFRYRGNEYDVEAPEDVLLSIIDAEYAETQEEREDARQLVDAWIAETEALLPEIHKWNSR